MIEVIYQLVALACPVGTVLMLGYIAWSSRRGPALVPEQDELEWAELARLRAQIDDAQLERRQVVAGGSRQAAE